MGMIRTYLESVKETWEGMVEGDPRAFMGLPRQGTGSGMTGTGPGTPPSTERLTDRQRQMLMRFFHDHYGRYPVSEFEFQQWLRDNW